MSGGVLKCLPTTPMMASSYVVGGALAPFGAAWLAEHGGVAWTGLVLSAAGLVTLAGVLLAPRRV